MGDCPGRLGRLGEITTDASGDANRPWPLDGAAGSVMSRLFGLSRDVDPDVFRRGSESHTSGGRDVPLSSTRHKPGLHQNITNETVALEQRFKILVQNHSSVPSRLQR